MQKDQKLLPTRKATKELRIKQFVFLLRRAKSEFFKTTFEIIRITPRESGRPANRSLVSISNKEKDLGNNEEMTEAINVHFSTIADKLRKLLPDVPFETSK